MNGRRHRRNELYFSKKKAGPKEIALQVIKYVITVIAALSAAFILVFCFAQSSEVLGSSMSPTLDAGDNVIMSRAAYIFSSPGRYDIVSFTKHFSSGDETYIKRIVGLPRETVQIRDGGIFIDGSRLDTPISYDLSTSGQASDEIHLGKNEYFVLGDNAANSEDSRFPAVGNVTRSEIKGKITAKRAGLKFYKVK